MLAVRAAQLHFVDIRLMKLDILRYRPDRARDQLFTAARRIFFLTGGAYPYVERRSPIAVPADVPVDKIFKEVAEAAFANVRWIPVYLAVVFN